MSLMHSEARDSRRKNNWNMGWQLQVQNVFRQCNFVYVLQVIILCTRIAHSREDTVTDAR